MEPGILDMGAAYTNDRNSSINTGKDLAGQLFSVSLRIIRDSEEDSYEGRAGNTVEAGCACNWVWG